MFDPKDQTNETFHAPTQATGKLPNEKSSEPVKQFRLDSN